MSTVVTLRGVSPAWCKSGSGIIPMEMWSGRLSMPMDVTVHTVQSVVSMCGDGDMLVESGLSVSHESPATT